MSKTIPQIVLFGACPIAVVVGLFLLTDYSARPSSSGNVVTNLSSIIEFQNREQSGTSFSHTESTLFFFYHPHCPCSVASIRCLERMSSKLKTRPNFIAYAYCPADEADSWISSTLTSTVMRIPKANVIVDRGGQLCSQFGVITSGHVLLYDPTGTLLFSGGVTPARGHEGDCFASADLQQKVDKPCGELTHWPVFGCAIVSGENQKR